MYPCLSNCGATSDALVRNCENVVHIEDYYPSKHPVNTPRSTRAGSMLVHRLLHWPSIEPTPSGVDWMMDQRFQRLTNIKPALGKSCWFDRISWGLGGGGGGSGQEVEDRPGRGKSPRQGMTQ